MGKQRFAPPIQIPAEMARSICHHFNLDQVIIYGRKACNPHDSEDDMEVLAHAGNSTKNAHIARVMAEFLKEKVFGWKKDSSGLLDEIANAEEVSPDGRVDGKKLLFLPNTPKRTRR